jgi:hypothetical protein
MVRMTMNQEWQNLIRSNTTRATAPGSMEMLPWLLVRKATAQLALHVAILYRSAGGSLL